MLAVGGTAPKLHPVKSETLAHKLGTTAHLSPLLMKARRLGLHGAEDLERLAIRRGCEYYNVNPRALALREEPGLIVRRADFSNAELAVALLSPNWPTSLMRQRMGAAMLSAHDIQIDELALLARQEECGGIVRYIAHCGSQVEPEHADWKVLEALLADCEYDIDQVPHPTRFIEMTGVTRGRVGIQKHWVRPVAALAIAG